MKHLLSIIGCCVALFTLTLTVSAQEADTLLVADTLAHEVEDKVTMGTEGEVIPISIEAVEKADDNTMLVSLKENKKERKLHVKKEYFTPDPKRATWYSIVCPGLGQIYNRSYWKLPIVYGGMLACTYLISWNGRMYNDYRNAYHDIIDNDPKTNSYVSLYPSYDGSQSWLPNTLKSKTNNYRRSRDISVFVMVLLYMVTAVDAFVDAHLYDFTVSDDLSLRVEPIINGIQTGDNTRTRSFGMQCSITF